MTRVRKAQIDMNIDRIVTSSSAFEQNLLMPDAMADQPGNHLIIFDRSDRVLYSRPETEIAEFLQAATKAQRNIVLGSANALDGKLDYPTANVPRTFVYRLSPMRAPDSDHVGGVVAAFREIYDSSSSNFSGDQSHDQLRQMIDALPVLISYINAQHRYTITNKTYELWRQQSGAELHGKHLRDVLGEEGYNIVLPHIETALSGKYVRYETVLNYNDGRRRTVEVTHIPDRRADGSVAGIVALVTDMTEHKLIEDELQKQVAETTLLYEAGRVLGKTLEIERVYDALQSMVERIMDCNSLLVSVYTPEDNQIRCAYAWIEGVRTDISSFPALTLAPEGEGMQSRVIRSGEPLLLSDIATQSNNSTKYYVNSDGTIDDTPDDNPNATRSALMIPINLEGRVMGTVQVMSHRKNAYTNDHVRVLRALSIQVAAASRNAVLYQQAQQEIAERKRVEEENKALIREIQESVVQQRTFLRDLLSSVTDGKLRLCDSRDDLPNESTLFGERVQLCESELYTLRHLISDAALALGFMEQRWQELVTAASEGAMNAVVHAGGGQAHVCSTQDTLQVWIEDQGHGIAVEHLPRATLEKGYTTAGTLGYGMKMMLASVDRIWLLTGIGGTTIVLEQDRFSQEDNWE